ncbi:hypothetical protein [Kitasatospora camelliae]|uniref:Uncharacterized protein n=1 Tax=Kitasatospora camelliae TaxID=3156397 RepID=A0AAU8JQU3_9ACTN
MENGRARGCLAGCLLPLAAVLLLVSGGWAVEVEGPAELSAGTRENHSVFALGTLVLGALAVRVTAVAPMLRCGAAIAHEEDGTYRCVDR